jgi:hypothetical protein
LLPARASQSQWRDTTNSRFVTCRLFDFVDLKIDFVDLKIRFSNRNRRQNMQIFLSFCWNRMLSRKFRCQFKDISYLYRNFWKLNVKPFSSLCIQHAIMFFIIVGWVNIIYKRGKQRFCFLCLC